MRREMLPDRPTEDPYEIRDFRVTHTHGDEEAPGTVMCEFAVAFPGIDEVSVIAVELELSQAMELMEDLIGNVNRASSELPCEGPDDE